MPREPDSTLVDRVKVYVISSGTGAFTLGDAVRAYRGSEVLVDGTTYSYAIESGAQYEIGRGEYVASLNSLSRSPTASSNGGTVVDFPTNSELALTALATDLSVVSAYVDAVLAVGLGSWADLQNFASQMQPGDETFVSAADTGTHVDPASGLTVNNAGVYEKQSGYVDPVRVRDLDSQAAASQVALASAEADRAALQAYLDSQPFANTTALNAYTNPALVLGDATIIRGDGRYQLTSLSPRTWTRTGDSDGKIASDAAITATATTPRALRRAAEPNQNLFDKNGPGIALNTVLRVSDGALITAGATGYNTSGFCNVQAGQTIINTRQIGFAGTGTYGLVWYDANDARISGLPASGSAPIPPFTPMVAPANAVSYRFCARETTSNDWGEMVIAYGSTPPPAVRTFKTLDKIAGRVGALDAQILRDRPKQDFASPDDFIRGAYRNVSGGFTFDANFGTSNRIAGYPGFTVVPTVSISGNLGIAYYDVDGTYLYTGNQSLAGSITVATNPRQIVLTAADGYAPAVGTPVSGTNIPAGSYVVSRSSPRTPCTVTISADATADSSGNYSFQGALSNVPITFPEEACSAEFPMTAGSFYYAQFLNAVPARGDVFKGLRYDGFAGLPLAGQETVLEGDSIMQSSAAGTGQPVTIPPGASAAVGVMQYLLQMFTQCDVTAYRGQSGKQVYQALSAYGSVGAMSSGDFASAALTASITSGSTAFSVTAGTPVAGRRITGPGIPEQTYIVSVSGTPGAYTGVLSRPAFATRSGACTIPYLRNYIDENITNSWGLATTDGTRAYAQVALGTLGDTWIPTLMNITFTNGSTAITINSTSLGAPVDGMPVSAVGGQKVSPGTTLVDLGGGSWALSQAAIAGGAVTVRGGSFYGDMYDISIRKLAAWSPQTRQILLGALRRFDSTAATSNSASPDYREGDPMNDLGVYLSQFNTARRLFAERWGFVFVDTFNRFPVNSLSYVGRFDAAKLHPNTQFVAENYAPFLGGELNKITPTLRG